MIRRISDIYQLLVLDLIKCPGFFLLAFFAYDLANPVPCMWPCPFFFLSNEGSQLSILSSMNVGRRC